QRAFVLPITMVIKLAERDVHLGEIGRESDRLLGHASELCQLPFTHLLHEPMTLYAVLNETSHGEREIRIVRDGLPVPGSRAVVRFRPEMRIGASGDQLYVDAHFVGGLLHTAFKHRRNSELLRYCL